MLGQRENIRLLSGQSFRVLRWCQSVREVEVSFAPGSSIRSRGQGDHWHYHPEMELTLVTAGEGTRFVGDHIAPFGPGDLVLLGGMLPHYWQTSGTSAGIAIQWNFPHGHPFWAFPETFPMEALFRNAARGLQFAGRTAEALRTGLQTLAKTYGAERLAWLLRLFASMAAAPETDRKMLSSRAFSLPADSAHQQAIAQAVRYLVANFREKVRMAEVLRLTGMSKATFARQFKKHSGKTLSDFLSEIRMQAACKELAETDTPVMEIALASGFGQISFFNRLFRRQLQRTPSQYRESARRARRSRRSPPQALNRRLTH